MQNGRTHIPRKNKKGSHCSEHKIFNYKDNLLLDYEHQRGEERLLTKNMKMGCLFLCPPKWKRLNSILEKEDWNLRNFEGFLVKGIGRHS